MTMGAVAVPSAKIWAPGLITSVPRGPPPPPPPPATNTSLFSVFIVIPVMMVIPGRGASERREPDAEHERAPVGVLALDLARLRVTHRLVGDVVHREAHVELVEPLREHHVDRGPALFVDVGQAERADVGDAL